MISLLTLVFIINLMLNSIKRGDVLKKVLTLFFVLIAVTSSAQVSVTQASEKELGKYVTIKYEEEVKPEDILNAVQEHRLDKRKKIKWHFIGPSNDDLKILSQLPPISFLEIETKKGEKYDLSPLSGHTSLKWLSIHPPEEEPIDLDLPPIDLKPLENTRSLCMVHIAHVSKGLQAFEKTRRLRFLDVYLSTPESLGSLKNCSRLIFLRLVNTGDPLKYPPVDILDLNAMRNLESLNLRGFCVGNQGGSFTPQPARVTLDYYNGSDLSFLKRVKFGVKVSFYAAFSKQGLDYLKDWQIKTRCLREHGICFNGKTITKEDIEEQKKMKEARTLSLGLYNMEEASIMKLFPDVSSLKIQSPTLSSLSGLEKLRLGSLRLKCPSLLSFPKLKKSKGSLKDLLIHEGKISDLTPLRKLRKLESLNLSLLSPKDIKIIPKLKKLKILTLVVKNPEEVDFSPLKKCRKTLRFSSHQKTINSNDETAMDEYIQKVDKKIRLENLKEWHTLYGMPGENLTWMNACPIMGRVWSDKAFSSKMFAGSFAH